MHCIVDNTEDTLYKWWPSQYGLIHFYWIHSTTVYEYRLRYTSSLSLHNYFTKTRIKHLEFAIHPRSSRCWIARCPAWYLYNRVIFTEPYTGLRNNNRCLLYKRISLHSFLQLEGVPTRGWVSALIKFTRQGAEAQERYSMHCIAHLSTLRD